MAGFILLPKNPFLRSMGAMVVRGFFGCKKEATVQCNGYGCYMKIQIISKFFCNMNILFKIKFFYNRILCRL